MGKQLSYYFPHDCNAHEDIKIKKLIRKYGYEGYGLWWHFLEIFRTEENFKLNYDIENLEIIFYPTEINLEEFVNYCLKINLFVLEENQIFSKSFLQRMEYYEEKSKKCSIAGKKGMTTRWKKDNDVITNVTENNNDVIKNYNDVTENDNNKTKQNKIKQNNIKQNNIEENVESVVVDVVVSESYQFFRSLFPDMTLDSEDYKIIQTYGKEKPELFNKACEIGKENGANTFKYMSGIISNWKSQGIQNLEDLKPKKKSKFANYQEDKQDYTNFDAENQKRLIEKYGGPSNEGI